MDLETILEGINDPAIFKAVFLAGGPGSGKSFVVGRTALQAQGLKLINSDDHFERLLSREAMKTDPSSIFSPRGQQIRQQAKYLTNLQMRMAINGRLGLVIDGTGKDIGKIRNQKQMLETMGYETSLVFVNTDLETAMSRNNSRPRQLPDDQVKKMWNEVQNNLGGFQRMFGQNMIIVDNSDGINTDQVLLQAYRDVQRFVKAPLKSRKALQWIKQQKAARMNEDIKKMDMGDVIKDFQKSDAPQFKGKSKKKKREMAIAAKLSAMDEAPKVPQDSDIAKRKGSQPAKYHAGLSKSTKQKRDAQFKKQAKMSDSNPAAYKPAAGDKNAKTKPSKYTKYVQKMMDEEKFEPHMMYHPETGKGIMAQRHSDHMRMSKLGYTLDEKCWDSHKQVGMKKKGNKMVPNCVPKNSVKEGSAEDRLRAKLKKQGVDLDKRAKERKAEYDRLKKQNEGNEDVLFDPKKYKKKDPMALPQIGKLRNVKKRVSKQRVKDTKVFDKIKIDESDYMVEVSMSDVVKSKSIYKDKYMRLANHIVSDYRKDKLRGGGRARHDVYYQAHEILRKMGQEGRKLNSRILGDKAKAILGEEYKYEWGTDDGTAYMKAVTPGYPHKTTKRNKSSSKRHYKVDEKSIQEEDGIMCKDGMYWCRQRKACVPIPDGYKDRGDGYIIRETVEEAIEHVNAIYKDLLERLDDNGKPHIAEPIEDVLSAEDIRDLLIQADNLSIDDMKDLGIIDEEEPEEELEIDTAEVQVTEALTPLGRIKRRQAARRNKTKLKLARVRALKRAGGNARIKLRATRGARNLMYKRLLRGRDKAGLPPSEKARLETMIQRFQPLIARIAVRILPQIRKTELSRLKNKRAGMKPQKAKKFVIKKGGNPSKYKAKKFVIKNKPKGSGPQKAKKAKTK